MRTVPHQVCESARGATAKRAEAVDPGTTLKQPHVTHHSAQKDAPMSRT